MIINIIYNKFITVLTLKRVNDNDNDLLVFYIKYTYHIKDTLFTVVVVYIEISISDYQCRFHQVAILNVCYGQFW